MGMAQPELLTTPLHEAHKQLKARLVPFAGYDMPVQYEGIMAEAKAVRTGCGMFDVSHMGRLNIRGSDALTFLENVTTNDVGRLSPMSGEYSLLPNDSGGCVDDIILYRLEDHFQMVVNAGNHQKAVDWLNGHIIGNVQIEDMTIETAMIAVQGPFATPKLEQLSGNSLEQIEPFGVIGLTLNGNKVQAARSGYTGEDGFELICRCLDANALWQTLLDAGVTPCGLGSRDTLRLEAGLPLYGHELNENLSPIAAGLGWVISKTKSFIGSEIINQVREDGPAQRLVGVRLEAKRLVPSETKILVGGAEVGYVTSGVVSPSFDTALALAYVNSDIKLGTACALELRGAQVPGQIVSKRFYKRA
jgi:aminomethyltransferase